MTQYNTLNVKLSNSQLNKIKSGMKNGTEVILKNSSNAIRHSNDDTNFPHKLLLTNTQVSRPRKNFANGSSANLQLSKIPLHKLGQSGGFLGRLLGPLLLEPLLKPFAKSILIPLRLTVASSATDGVIQKNVWIRYDSIKNF